MFFSVGLGSIYGTFTPPLPHQSDAQPVKARTKDDIKHEPRNFLVSPAKKGGYGYYHTTIGGKEYPYSVEDPAKVQARERAFKKPRAQTAGPSRPAFVSTSHGNRLFTGNAIYTEDPTIIRRSLSAPRRRAMSATMGDPKMEARPPFRAMSATRGTLNPFPEYNTRQ